LSVTLADFHELGKLRLSKDLYPNESKAKVKLKLSQMRMRETLNSEFPHFFQNLRSNNIYQNFTILR